MLLRAVFSERFHHKNILNAIMHQSRERLVHCTLYMAFYWPTPHKHQRRYTVVEVEAMEVESLDEVTASLRLKARQLRLHQLPVNTHAHGGRCTDHVHYQPALFTSLLGILKYTGGLMVYLCYILLYFFFDFLFY